MISSKILEILPEDYVQIIQRASQTGDFSEIQQRINDAISNDTLMQPYKGEKGTKYYKSFIQIVVPKILPVIQDAIIQTEDCFPEIEISFQEIDSKRKELKIDKFGSPQDVLYGFTSERYSNWGNTLKRMGFISAFMIGEQRAVVTMAPRYLSINQPDIIVDELEGSVSRDFWESNEVVFLKLPFIEQLRDIFASINERDELLQELQAILDDSIKSNTAQLLLHLISSKIALNLFDTPNTIKLEILCEEFLMPIINIEDQQTRIKKTKNLTNQQKKGLKISQEQLALKYAEEGKFLQKLLKGYKVEHLQSNVKMVTNIMRKSKCEVDSIYRVLGEKRIVLLETKGKSRISTTQLYHLYETYRLKIPSDWEIDIVAILMSDPTEEQRKKGFVTIIDLIQVFFDNNVLGNITESLIAIRPELHYRWQIKRQN